MKEKLSFKESLLIGSLLFGLFFGAGNLMFPIELGQEAGRQMPWATLGFLITGVGLAVLTIVSMAMSRTESLFDMARPAGDRYAAIYTALLYLTIGPFFAIPRTATFAFEVGVRSFELGGSDRLWLLGFTLVFFLANLYFSLRPGRIIDIIGKYMTPIFLLLLGALILAAITRPMGRVGDQVVQEKYQSYATAVGLLDGYQTMDGLAGLAFGIIIITNIQKLGIRGGGRIAKEVVRAGVYCVLAMSFIYASLAYMGASSVAQLGRLDNGGLILSAISSHYLGQAGKVLLAAIVILACLKTAIGVTTACSTMFAKMYPQQLTYNQLALIFTTASFLIANVGLATIVAYSVPVLQFLYPIAIMLTLWSMLVPVLGKHQGAYQWALGLTALAALGDLLKALPEAVHFPGLDRILSVFQHLPGFDLGFGWLLPAGLGLVLGLIISWRNKERVPA